MVNPQRSCEMAPACLEFVRQAHRAVGEAISQGTGSSDRLDELGYALQNIHNAEAYMRVHEAAVAEAENAESIFNEPQLLLVEVEMEVKEYEKSESEICAYRLFPGYVSPELARLENENGIIAISTTSVVGKTLQVLLQALLNNSVHSTATVSCLDGTVDRYTIIERIN